MKFINDAAHDFSSKLAEEKEPFANWDISIYGSKEQNIKMRNLKSIWKFAIGFKDFQGWCSLDEKKLLLCFFDFKKSVKVGIHSFFVFFPFYAIWLDVENNIIDVQKVDPWKFLVLPTRKYNKLIEIPINKKYEKIISLLGVTTTNSKSLKRVFSSIK